jgi:hypothetical protein
MVVITSCPGINVEILVDGQPLQEYDAVDVSPTPANTATKYIEARSDAEFAVRVTVDNDCLFPAADFAINMELDGKQLSGSLFHAKYFYRAQGLVVSSHSIQLSPKSSADQKICFTAFNIGKIPDASRETPCLTNRKQWMTANTRMSSAYGKNSKQQAPSACGYNSCRTYALRILPSQTRKDQRIPPTSRSQKVR